MVVLPSQHDLPSIASAGGLMEPGVTVNVRYDSNNKKRVLLMDDVTTLLRARIKP